MLLSNFKKQFFQKNSVFKNLLKMINANCFCKIKYEQLSTKVEYKGSLSDYIRKRKVNQKTGCLSSQ